MSKVGMVSLGCDKNTVDSEKLLAKLSAHGHMLVSNPAEAEYIIINTCAFIESAKKEAIDIIMEMAEYRKDGLTKLIIIGCLANRYYDELIKELPEADYIVKINDYDSILKIISKNTVEQSSSGRIITTPYHYAYLKISEGCDNRCTYCAIPKIRGRYRSDKIESLEDEAKRLIDDYGIKELILVAQDITRYGYDIYGEYSLIKLLDRLEKLDLGWIRLMYCYPELVTDELLRRVSESDKIAKYLDIPFQHISDRILNAMKRRNTKADTYKLVDRIKNIDEQIAIRSTFIVGFPGESANDYDELKQFIKYAELDNVGIFAFSREAGTEAYHMKDRVDKRTAHIRERELYSIQTETVLRKYKKMIGMRIKVMYEDIDYDSQCFLGRSERSAPVIDSRVLFTGECIPEPGQFLNVVIDGNNKLDLTAKFINER